MSYKDVREWIQQVQAMGELKVIEGADWNLEIGALSVLASKHKENSPALLFDCSKTTRRVTGFSLVSSKACAAPRYYQSSPRHHAGRIHSGLPRTVGEAAVDPSGKDILGSGNGKCL